MRSNILWDKDDLFNYSTAQCGTLDDIGHARSHLGLAARKRETSQLLIDLFELIGISKKNFKWFIVLEFRCHAQL